LPKLIIIDWHMPAGGGPQLLLKLRDKARTSRIPVYVITADDSPEIPLRPSRWERRVCSGSRSIPPRWSR
jgi:CheY-like chemotaxis protein